MDVNGLWTHLPEMREGKCGFNPCAFSIYVYICGNPSTLIEAFSPLTSSFLPLQLSLPEPYNYNLYVHDHLLVIHSYSWISKFAAGNEGQLVKHSQVASVMPVNKYTNSQPVVDPVRSLFYIFQGEKCLCFHMETAAQVKTFI